MIIWNIILFGVLIVRKALKESFYEVFTTFACKFLQWTF